jgi:hypothetical protein
MPIPSGITHCNSFAPKSNQERQEWGYCTPTKEGAYKSVAKGSIKVGAFCYAGRWRWVLLLGASVPSSRKTER